MGMGLLPKECLWPVPTVHFEHVADFQKAGVGHGLVGDSGSGVRRIAEVAINRVRHVGEASYGFDWAILVALVEK